MPQGFPRPRQGISTHAADPKWGADGTRPYRPRIMGYGSTWRPKGTKTGFPPIWTWANNRTNPGRKA